MVFWVETKIGIKVTGFDSGYVPFITLGADLN